MSNLFFEIVLCSVLEAALGVTVILFCRKQNKYKIAVCAVKWLIFTGLVYNFVLFYFFMPMQDGFLLGQGWTLFAAFIYLGLVGITVWANEKDEVDGFALVSLACVAILLEALLWTGTAISVNWGGGNAANFANLANIITASAEEKLPETDPNKMVLVTRDMAQYLGQQALNSEGDNLGSIFQVRPDEWVLQSIREHLYYASPLEYSFWPSQFGLFTNKVVSPGFLLVDAENPNVPARLVRSAPLHILPGALLQDNLDRVIYQQGYTYFDQPLFEVDDENRPHYTAAVLSQKFAVDGTKIVKVLVIDATTGAVTEYAPNSVPSWVDRVSSSSLVTEWVTQWGRWTSAKSRTEWPNFGGQYMVQPEAPELVYSSSDVPVWLIPIRSISATNSSSTGVLLYDTRDNRGIFYPGLSGLGVGDNVIHALQNASGNIRSYPIDAVQLYSISGVPTWLGVYTQAQGQHGKSLAAVGLLDARHLNGANVIIAPDLHTALARYSAYLASGGGLSPDEISRLANVGTATGQIKRLGQAVQGGETSFFILLEGEKLPFTATLSVSRLLPVMKEGDVIKVEYIDGSERAVTKIDDQNLAEEKVSTIKH